MENVRDRSGYGHFFLHDLLRYGTSEDTEINSAQAARTSGGRWTGPCQEGRDGRGFDSKFQV